jgi:hypothetical protein
MIRLANLLDVVLHHQAAADDFDVIDIHRPSGAVVAPAEQ